MSQNNGYDLSSSRLSPSPTIPGGILEAEGIKAGRGSGPFHSSLSHHPVRCLRLSLSPLFCFFLLEKSESHLQRKEYHRLTDMGYDLRLVLFLLILFVLAAHRHPTNSKTGASSSHLPSTLGSCTAIYRPSATSPTRNSLSPTFIPSKMLFSAVAATVLMAGLTAVSAETHVVAVGKAGSLLYEPPSVTAKAGDIVEFQLYVLYLFFPNILLTMHFSMSKNHTITQSTFDKPCQAKAEGVDSGYQFIPAGTSSFPSWSITVQNDTAPLWFYCAQAPHCAKGMVFAINPTAEKTFEKFHAAALATDATAGTAGAASGSYGGAAGGGMGGAYGGAAPAGTTTTASASTGLPVANAASGATEVGALTDTNPGNGALGRAVGSWHVVVGAVVVGALVL